MAEVPQALIVIASMTIGASLAILVWWSLTWWPLSQAAKPKLHNGWEAAEDPPVSEPYPTRRQCTLLVLAHQTWLEILREHSTKVDGTEHPTWIIHRQIEKCETTLQLAEVLARSWFETALSIITCGVPTGAPFHVLGMIARVHGEDRATAARAIVAETAAMVSMRLNHSGFSVPDPDRPHEVLEKAQQLAVETLPTSATDAAQRAATDAYMQPILERLAQRKHEREKRALDALVVADQPTRGSEPR